MLALLDNPEELTRVTANPSLVPNMIEEALRYESPVQMIMRACTRDADVGGATIPAGSLVMPMYASANRDERQFPEPDRFDVARSNARDHVAFGYGPHFCLGAPLSRLEGLVAYEEIRGGCRRSSGSRNGQWLPSMLIRGRDACPHVRARLPRTLPACEKRRD
jgi:cytochrome P450